MSDQYKYKCNSCGFSIWTDDRGCECIMSGISYLYLCESCRTLVEKREDVSFTDSDVVMNNPHWWISGKGISVKDDGKCPICKSDNGMHKWNPVDCKCPKCSGDMHKDEWAGVLHTD